MADLAQNWGGWQRWTPALTATTTDPNLGTSPTQEGRVDSLGTTVRWTARIVFGTSSTAGSGYYQLALPLDPVAVRSVVGHGVIAEDETPHMPWTVLVMVDPVLAASVDADPALPFVFTTERDRSITAIAADYPAEWSAGDSITLAGSYEAATS